MTQHPSKYELKCRFAGTRDYRQNNETEAHLLTCKTCQTVVKQLEDDRAEFLDRKPASLFLQQLETRVRNENRKKQKSWRLAIAAFATSGVLAVVLLISFNTTETSGQDALQAPSVSQQSPSMRWMGNGVSAKIHVRRNGATFISDGTQPQNGDRLRYEVMKSGTDKAYVSVFAVQDGEVFSLLPQSDSHAPYKFTDHLVVPGSVVIEPGGEKVELFLFVQPTQYTIESIKNEMVHRLREHKDLSQMDGLVHRLNATPVTETK